MVSVQLQRDLNGKVDLDVRSDQIRGSHLSQLGQDLNGESDVSLDLIMIWSSCGAMDSALDF